jgi:hypothetical protein
MKKRRMRMKVIITKEDGGQMTICDGAECAGQVGKFAQVPGTGRTSVARGLHLMQGSGRQFMRPDTESVAVVFTLTVSVLFKDDAEAEAFRLTYPAEFPTGAFSVCVETKAKPVVYADASLQSLMIDQSGATCAIAYSIKASIKD